MKNRKEYEEPSLIGAIWVLFLLLVVFGGLLAISEIERSNLRIELNKKIDFSFINRGNTDIYCREIGNYTESWAGCSFDFGFTCVNADWEKVYETKCYSFSDLYLWKINQKGLK